MSELLLKSKSVGAVFSRVVGSVACVSLALAVGCGSSSTVTPNGGACTFGEPNNAREQASTIAVNTTYAGLCVGDATDPSDFFEFTAPNDVAGGYVAIEMSNVSANGLAAFTVFSVVDNQPFVDTYTTDNGASIKGWFTVAPGAKYRVETQRFAGAGEQYTYTLRLSYTPINDTYEPNNTRADAKPITVGTPIKASGAAHAATGVDLAAGADDDWYKVTLAGGTATITVSDVPSDYMCDVSLVNAAGESIGEQYSTDMGANCTLKVDSLTAGDYSVLSHEFAGRPAHGAAGELPNFVTKQYTLTVVQP